jgi:O-antigen/teichoic acid export membrane protein
MVGQIVFVLSGYFVNIMLSRRLGVEQYGIFGVVTSVLVWVELSVIVGIPTAMQKFIGEDQTHAHTLRKIAFGMQLKYSIVIFVLFFLSADVLADLLNDHRLAFYLRVASINIVLYALYRLFINVHNGMKNFGRQTLASIIYAVGKMAAIFLLVWQGMAVVGALIGNAIGTVLGLCSAIFLKADVKPSEHEFEKKKIIRYATPIILFTLLINLFLSLDLWFVQAVLDSTSAGYYVAASTIAKAPYFLFLALSFTLLPSLAKAKKEYDKPRVQQLIWQSTRILVVSMSLIIALVISSATEIIELLFTDLYAPAAVILQILICGLSFLTVFLVFATMLNVDDRPSSSMWICAAVIAVNVAMNLWLVPRYGIIGAASATTISTFAGMMWAGAVVYRKFVVALSLRSIVKIAIATVVAFLFGELMPDSISLLLLKWATITAAFGGMLFVLGEFRAEEVSRLKNALLSRNKGKAVVNSTS